MRKTHINKLVEVAGWYGTIAILGAYALVSFSIIKSDGLFYQLLNLTGAIGMIAVTYYKKVYQSVILNIIWSIVGIIAIIRIIF